MSRASELRLRSITLCIGLAVAASAQAQSIGDYSRSQRAVLESEMAKNTAKALSNANLSSPPANPTPQLASPASASRASTQQPPLPSMLAPPVEAPAPLAPPELAVTGVIVLQKRAMVELAVRGETVLLLTGDPVPGTSWTVAHIRPDQVVLKSGSKSRLFHLNAGAR